MLAGKRAGSAGAIAIRPVGGGGAASHGNTNSSMPQLPIHAVFGPKRCRQSAYAAWWQSERKKREAALLFLDAVYEAHASSVEHIPARIECEWLDSASQRQCVAGASGKGPITVSARLPLESVIGAAL